MVGMGFTSEEIKDSLLNQKYNEVTATYLLLGRKGDVSSSAFTLFVFTDNPNQSNSQTCFEFLGFFAPF